MNNAQSGVDVAEKRTLAEEIGGRLYDERTRRRGNKRGRSQAELSRDSGVPQQRISQIEKGLFDAGIIEQLRQLARTLGVSESYLTFGETTPEERNPAVRLPEPQVYRHPQAPGLHHADDRSPPSKKRRKSG